LLPVICYVITDCYWSCSFIFIARPHAKSCRARYCFINSSSPSI